MTIIVRPGVLFGTGGPSPILNQKKQTVVLFAFLACVAAVRPDARRNTSLCSDLDVEAEVETWETDRCWWATGGMGLATDRPS